MRALSTEAEWNNGEPHYKFNAGRYTFRCDHHYEDGSCYGGPDGGGCSKRKKREELISRPPEVNSSRSLSVRQKRQIDDVIGCQKE